MDAPVDHQSEYDSSSSEYNSSSSMQAGEVDQTFVESLRQKIQSKAITILREEAGSSSCCIHRVPPTLRQHDEKAYTPLVVSLGPFHHGNPMLKSMEEHKWRYLDKALSRATDEALESFSRAIKGLAQKARDCYSEIIHLENDELVQMMVLDGCFIVQIVLNRTFRNADPNDPIFRQIWLLHQITRDMLLLENQIPFFVLGLLFNLIKSSMEISDSLVSIFCKFFKVFGLYKHGSDVNPRHLLHLVQLCILPDEKNRPKNPIIEEIPRATRLHEAGMRFECLKLKHVDKNSFLDIMFQNGTLKIPLIRIGDSRSSLFLNLIAFEQCYAVYCGLYITAYMSFMNWLVDSADDVLILRRKGIIKHSLGSDEEVADLFNKLGKDVVISHRCFYLSDVVKRINLYHIARCHSWRASLVQKYFYSPWASISLTGAIILLLLTALQTFLAVFSYFKPRS